MSLQVKTERGTAEVGLRSSAAMEAVILPLIYEPDGTEIHMSIDKVTVKSTAEELLPQKWRCAEISLCKERRSRGRSPRAFARPHERKRRRPATTGPRSVVVASVVHGGAAGTGSTKLLSPAMMPGNTVPFAPVSIRATTATICRGVGRQQGLAGGVASRGPPPCSAPAAANGAERQGQRDDPLRQGPLS